MHTSESIVYITELPKPVTYTGGFYVGSILLYNISSSYIDAKMALQMFRENKLDEPSVKNEWDAVKYGANMNLGERFWNSILWPITVANNIVPWVVLAMNPKKS